MSIEPLTSWSCDVCHKPVGKDDGYVVWDRNDDPNFAFQIIHQGRCDNDRRMKSMPLRRFLGPDGLVKLTSMLSPGPVILQVYDEEMEKECRHPPLHAWVDFLRRVQIPYYEESRSYLHSPEAREEMNDWNEVSPYLQDWLPDLAERGQSDD